MINLNILKMASDTKYYGLKNIYTHQAKIKNRVCGDIIEIEVKIRKDKINLMRYQTEACIFCQASASILANQIKKFSIKSLKQDINFFSKLIQNKEDQLPAKFKSLKKLINKENSKRFDCIMLPFKALLKALKI